MSVGPTGNNTVLAVENSELSLKTDKTALETIESRNSIYIFITETFWLYPIRTRYPPILSNATAAPDTHPHAHTLPLYTGSKSANFGTQPPCRVPREAQSSRREQHGRRQLRLWSSCRRHIRKRSRSRTGTLGRAVGLGQRYRSTPVCAHGPGRRIGDGACAMPGGRAGLGEHHLHSRSARPGQARLKKKKKLTTA